MFTLTRQERKVLIFIGGLILLGSLLRFLNLNFTCELLPLNQNKAISAQGVAFNKLININMASAESLESIPGIGKIISRRIIAYRTQFGFFEKLEDLKKISGIGDKKIESIKRYIVVQ